MAVCEVTEMAVFNYVISGLMMDVDNPTAKNINSLLNSPKTRVEGLRRLNSYLQDCSDEVFIECCNNWMQNCCKTDGFSIDVNYSVETLKKLFAISANYPELNKSVSFFITNRFFDHFFKYFVDSEYGWDCAKTCFSLYRGPCRPSQENIEKHLINNLKRNAKISSNVSDCFALLPSLGGGGNEGINYQTNWMKQFVKYIQITHSILNEMFADVEEFQEYDTSGHTYISGQKQPDFDYLTIQLFNHCSILNSMLVSSYPAPKCISTDMVLELVCRGLAINLLALRKKETTASISLQKVLPEVHASLHNLLNALIATCGSQLLPYSFLICKLIKQTLEWTQSDFIYGSEKQFGSLRISAYETMCNWVIATKTGSCIESIANLIISHIISDIESKKTTVLLKESKSKQRLSGTKQQSQRRIDTSANACLCYAALQALQYLLKFSGVLLKVEDHKCLQETIVKLLVGIQNSFPTEVLIPYSVPICRKALYCVMLELVNQPCPKWPPPTHFAFRIFKKGENDHNPQVSQFCTTALNSLAVVIHQQFSNGPFLTTESTNYERQNQANENIREELLRMEDEIMGGENESVEVENDTVAEGPTAEEEELENPVDCEKEDSNENKIGLKSPGMTLPSSHTFKTPSPRMSPANKDCSRSHEEISRGSSPIIENKDLLQETTFSNEKKESFQEANRLVSEEVSIEKRNISEFNSSAAVNENFIEAEQRTVGIEKDECFRESNKVYHEESDKNRKISECDSSVIGNKECLQQNTVASERNEKFQETIRPDDEPMCKKNKMSEGELPTTPESSVETTPESRAKNSNDSPENKDKSFSETSDNDNASTLSKKFKNREVNASEDSNSESSTCPELATDERQQSDFKKRYFLRSKTRLSEEPEESLKRTDSVDSIRSMIRSTSTISLGRNTPSKSLGRNTPTKNLGRNTPTKNLGRNTPTKSLGRVTPKCVPSTSKRQRTRASTKFTKFEEESESAVSKKSGLDDDDDDDNDGDDEDGDILEAFYETFAE